MGTATAVNIVFGYAQNATELAKVMTLQPAASFTVNAGNIQAAQATTPANCQVAYAAAANATTPPTYTPTISSAGCQ